MASGLVDEPGVFIFGVKHDEPDFVQMMDAAQVQSGSHRTFHVVMVNRTSDLKPQGAKTSRLVETRLRDDHVVRQLNPQRALFPSKVPSKGEVMRCEVRGARCLI